MLDFFKSLKKKKGNAATTESIQVDVPEKLNMTDAEMTAADDTTKKPAIVVPEENKVVIEETIIIVHSSEDDELAKKAFQQQWAKRKKATDDYAESTSRYLPRARVNIVKSAYESLNISGLQQAKASEAYMTAPFLNAFTVNCGKFVLTDVFPNDDAMELLEGVMGVMKPFNNLMVVESKLSLDPDGGKSPHLFIRIPYNWGVLNVQLANWDYCLLNYTLLDCVNENGKPDGKVLFDYIMAYDAPMYAWASVSNDYFNGNEACIHGTAEYALLTLCGAIARSAVAEINETLRNK